jgi:cyanate permease
LALINAVGASAGFLGPYIVGILRGLTGDFKWALIVLAGSAFATAALAALLPYNRIIAQRSTGNQAEGRMEVA